MNERGFFSIVGLCLMLVITLSIMAIQGMEKNYSYLASDFQVEFELQNAADSGLIEAVEKIQSGEVIVNPPNETEYIQNRRHWQRKISVSQPSDTDRLKNISVEVYGEQEKISMYERIYSFEDDYTGTNFPYRDIAYKRKFSNGEISGEKQDWNGIILISVASGENDLGMKKFRRSLAYIFFNEDGASDEDKFIIHFMNNAERGGLKTS